MNIRRRSGLVWKVALLTLALSVLPGFSVRGKRSTPGQTGHGQQVAGSIQRDD